MLSGIQNVLDAADATIQFLMMSFPSTVASHIIKRVTWSLVFQSVMSVDTSCQQMQLVLLNIECILFGPRNTVLDMSMTELLGAVAVSEWSHGTPDMLPLTMVEPYVQNVWTQQSWILTNASPFIVT